MTSRRTGYGIFFALLLFNIAGSSAAAPELSREEGDRLHRKMEEIAENSSKNPIKPKRTPVSETEVNSYLAYNAKDRIPAGLAHPQITILGDNRLSGRITVDIDEFKRHRGSQGFTDPFNYISGKVPVTARGLLRTQDGKGQLQLESAQIHGIPLPKRLLQELVTFFSRTPEHPAGFDIDAPFDLPAKIREVTINRGQAVVVQ